MTRWIELLDEVRGLIGCSPRVCARCLLKSPEWEIAMQSTYGIIHDFTALDFARTIVTWATGTYLMLRGL